MDTKELDKTYVAGTYKRFPVEIVSGKGSVVCDPDGKTYIDMGSGSSNILVVGGSDKIAPNPHLKWETTITRDIGIDYGFFNERLTGAIDF